MAKISANYEVVFVLDPAQGEEAIAAQVANFKALAEQNGSDVVVEEWGWCPSAGERTAAQTGGGAYGRCRRVDRRKGSETLRWPLLK